MSAQEHNMPMPKEPFKEKKGDMDNKKMDNQIYNALFVVGSIVLYIAYSPTIVILLTDIRHSFIPKKIPIFALHCIILVTKSNIKY